MALRDFKPLPLGLPNRFLAYAEPHCSHGKSIASRVCACYFNPNTKSSTTA